MVKKATDDWDDDDGDDDVDEYNHDSKKHGPQYGGTPGYLNHQLAMARENDDGDTQAEVHRLRAKFFRNRRNPEQKIYYNHKARAKFVARYGDAAQIALAYDDERRKVAAMTNAEKADYLKLMILESESKKGSEPLPPPPATPTRRQ